MTGDHIAVQRPTVSGMTRGRLGAVAAMLLLAFGVLTMHVMSTADTTTHSDHAAHECGHGHDCTPIPMAHLGAMCAAALAVVITVFSLLRARRGFVPLPLTMPQRVERERTATPSAPTLAILCILRC